MPFQIEPSSSISIVVCDGSADAVTRCTVTAAGFMNTFTLVEVASEEQDAVVVHKGDEERGQIVGKWFCSNSRVMRINVSETLDMISFGSEEEGVVTVNMEREVSEEEIDNENIDYSSGLVYVCCAKSDLARAQEIASTLTSMGIEDSFYIQAEDENRYKETKPFFKRTVRMLKKSNMALILHSRHSSINPVCQKIMSLIVEKKDGLCSICVLMDKTSRTPSLSQMMSCNLMTDGTEGLYQKLVKTFVDSIVMPSDATETGNKTGAGEDIGNGTAAEDLPKCMISKEFDVKVAFVCIQSNYRTVSLQALKATALGVCEQLVCKGFSVIKVLDTSKSTIQKKFLEFVQETQGHPKNKGVAALAIFVGHAACVNGVNSFLSSEDSLFSRTEIIASKFEVEKMNKKCCVNLGDQAEMLAEANRGDNCFNLMIVAAPQFSQKKSKFDITNINEISCENVTGVLASMPLLPHETPIETVDEFLDAFSENLESKNSFAGVLAGVQERILDGHTNGMWITNRAATRMLTNTF